MMGLLTMVCPEKFSFVQVSVVVTCICPSVLVVVVVTITARDVFVVGARD